MPTDGMSPSNDSQWVLLGRMIVPHNVSPTPERCLGKRYVHNGRLTYSESLVQTEKETTKVDKIVSSQLPF